MNPLELFMQVKPDSRDSQSLDQPSLLLLLPSSHTSLLMIILSPQTSVHVSADDAVPFSHIHPVSNVHVLSIICY